MITQINQLRNTQIENSMHMQSAMSSLRVHIDGRFKMVQKNIDRMNPLYRKQTEAATNRNPASGLSFTKNGELIQTRGKPARLSKRCRNLNFLWQEWLVGLEGNEATKDFKSFKRRKVKSVFSKRMHIWRCVAKHVNAGHTAEIAINRIYGCFGYNLSVTKIILAIQASLSHYGALGHPNLRV